MFAIFVIISNVIRLFFLNYQNFTSKLANLNENLKQRMPLFVKMNNILKSLKPLVPVANLETIEFDLNECHEARSIRNQPSPVIRSQTTPQDATLNRITLDF